jgi:uncharacterized membrane protein affecting hemolysin expression
MPSGRWRTGYQLANLLHPGIIGALRVQMDTEVVAVRQNQRMYLASSSFSMLPIKLAVPTVWHAANRRVESA